MLDAVQLPLFAGEDFDPLGTDPRRYLAALLKRPGELLALRGVSEDVWPWMTPLIRIVGPRSGRGRPTQAATVRGWMKDVAQAIGHRPCYLHLLRSRADAPVLQAGAEQALLDCIFESARAEGIRFAPVLPSPVTVDHFKIVHRSVLYDGHGAALLHPVLDSVPIRSLREDLLGATEKLELEAQSVDVLLDLGWIAPDVEVDADDLARLVDQVSAIADWRSLALLGTSIPSTMASVAEGTVGSLPRREWTLWRSLQRRAPGRLPIFGDYGVQHPAPPPDGGGGGGARTMRANIRYTVNDRTLVVRGMGAVADVGKGQYRELCQQLVLLPEYAGSAFSQGDRIIGDCADGFTEPGSQTMWRHVGTSHHLNVVVKQLASAGG